MTKSEKLDLLEHLRLGVEVSIVTGRYIGLCSLMKCHRYAPISLSLRAIMLRELGIKKPFLVFPVSFWWPLTERGMKKRLKAVEGAIEKLEKI